MTDGQPTSADVGDCFIFDGSADVGWSDQVLRNASGLTGHRDTRKAK